MSYWNHRVVKQRMKDGSEWFSVREVFYNDDGSIVYTESPVDISGESIEAMREYCQWVLNCLDKDMLVEDEITRQGAQLTGLCECNIFIPSAHSTALVCRVCGKPPHH